MAPKKLLPVVLLALLLLATNPTADAGRGRELGGSSCKYVGKCSTQAQCSSMCNGSGYSPHSVFCDAHKLGGPQCCCFPSS